MKRIAFEISGAKSPASKAYKAVLASLNARDFFAYALKQAWATIKRDAAWAAGAADREAERQAERAKALQVDFSTAKVVGIQQWFLSKNMSSNEAYAIQAASYGDFRVEKESEKAVLLSIATDYGKIKSWFPKVAVVLAMAA